MIKKILVTGGTGYIGSHTIVELQNVGYDVICVDNLSRSNIDVIDRIESITSVSPQFEKVELCDFEQVEDFFSRNTDIIGIIHFAAYKLVNESVAEPLSYYYNNLNSLINVLKMVKKHNIEMFVFSSSCTVYGQPDVLPVTESTPLQPPASPYGNTKKICEEILKAFLAEAPDTKIVSLRYFNPIGAHPSALIGELPVGIPNNLLPYITQTAIGVREYLRVFGGDYDTHDGTAVRDYIHVVDLADAHVKAIDRMLQNKSESNYEIFNLGTGTGYSVLDVVKAFGKVIEKPLNHKIVERRPGDIEKIWTDPALANQKLNWKTKYSLDDMVRTAWNWEVYYRENGGFPF